MLYGCVQASQLWYNKLTKFLCNLGYEALPTDPCVMRKIVDGKISLLVIYVDDILVLAEEKETVAIRDAFVEAFQWITMEIGDTHSYLGMVLKLRDGHAIVERKILLKRHWNLVESRT